MNGVKFTSPFEAAVVVEAFGAGWQRSVAREVEDLVAEMTLILVLTHLQIWKRDKAELIKDSSFYVLTKRSKCSSFLFNVCSPTVSLGNLSTETETMNKFWQLKGERERERDEWDEVLGRGLQGIYN